MDFIIWLTFQVSHGYGWRGSCAAGGVTAMAVGSDDWLGILDDRLPVRPNHFVHVLSVELLEQRIAVRPPRKSEFGIVERHEREEMHLLLGADTARPRFFRA